MSGSEKMEQEFIRKAVQCAKNDIPASAEVVLGVLKYVEYLEDRINQLKASLSERIKSMEQAVLDGEKAEKEVRELRELKDAHAQAENDNYGLMIGWRERAEASEAKLALRDGEIEARRIIINRLEREAQGLREERDEAKKHLKCCAPSPRLALLEKVAEAARKHLEAQKNGRPLDEILTPEETEMYHALAALDKLEDE